MSLAADARRDVTLARRPVTLDVHEDVGELMRRGIGLPVLLEHEVHELGARAFEHVLVAGDTIGMIVRGSSGRAPR